jgi:hypothetical protein
MNKKEIIQEPHIYITPDLEEGQLAVVHIVYNKQRFLNLIFKEEKKDMIIPYVNTDKELNLETNLPLKEEIRKIEDRIVALGELFTCYNYLLTVKNGEIYLLSVSLTELSLGFDITKSIAEKINIKTLQPSWTGIYTTYTPAAFIEDIFIQKK